MRYINKYENSAAIQAAVDNEQLGKPYVAYDMELGKIVWGSKNQFKKMPLTFEITGDGYIDWFTETEEKGLIIEYKLNDGDWTELGATTEGTHIDVVSGDTVQFRGKNDSYFDLDLNSIVGSFNGSTCEFNVKGNIMSLINSTNYTNLTSFPEGSSDNFAFLFDNCTGLTDASNLLLPATTLANDCYFAMFNDCHSLTTAPELPATTLAEECYGNMFKYCTSLTTAPELPATTLAEMCYANMFEGCTNLNYIKCLATDISATDCTIGWAIDVAETGTFITPSTTNWTTGVNGIPTNWTRVNSDVDGR